MPSYRQLFFIEDNLIAEALRQPLVRRGAPCSPSSDLYYCPHCGEVWARLPVIDDAGNVSQWSAYCSICRKCAKHQKYGCNRPGSIWRSWDTDFVQALPVPVLEWELLRHIEAYERIPYYGR